MSKKTFKSFDSLSLRPLFKDETSPLTSHLDTYNNSAIFNNATLYKVLFHDVLRKMYILPSLFAYVTKHIADINTCVGTSEYHVAFFEMFGDPCCLTP